MIRTERPLQNMLICSACNVPIVAAFGDDEYGSRKYYVWCNCTCVHGNSADRAWHLWGMIGRSCYVTWADRRIADC